MVVIATHWNQMSNKIFYNTRKWTLTYPTLPSRYIENQSTCSSYNMTTEIEEMKWQNRNYSVKEDVERQQRNT